MSRFVAALVVGLLIASFADADADDAAIPRISAIPVVGGPLFSDVGAGLTSVAFSSAAWGDYDNDGDLDILLTGDSGSGNLVAQVYRNGGGANPAFSDIGAGLIGVRSSSVAWGDYDNDGDLDILLTGRSAGGPVARVYRNSGGANPTFSDIGAGLIGVEYSSVAWGDYDNDGDLDILLTGSASPTSRVAVVYRNSGGLNPTFSDVGAGLTAVEQSSVAWGDYDNDGDLDILVTGDSGSTSVARVYRNGGGTNPAFSDIGASLVGVQGGSVAWGDCDNDGDLDILLTGYTGSVDVARVYRNGGGVNPTFSDFGAGLPGVDGSSVAWGDYDNDGSLDILVTGVWMGGFMARVYRNSGGANPTFSDIAAGLSGVFLSSVAWGDYDNDGDLDILLAGLGSVTAMARVYRNGSSVPNAPPAAPAGLSASGDVGSGTTFTWNAATDAQTPAAALTYNLRVGTTPGGHEIASAMAAADGFRRVPRIGNANHNLEWSLSLPFGTYYWSVQAVDAAFAGSPFADEQSFTLTSVNVQNEARPLSFALGGSQPNPFSRSTTIEFDLPREAAISLRVYDVSGRLVRRLAEGGPKPAGRHRVVWDGRTDSGEFALGGVYFYVMEADGFRSRRRMVLMR
jgi:hypothetical protein